MGPGPWKVPQLILQCSQCGDSQGVQLSQLPESLGRQRASVMSASSSSCPTAPGGTHTRQACCVYEETCAETGSRPWPPWHMVTVWDVPSSHCSCTSCLSSGPSCARGSPLPWVSSSPSLSIPTVVARVRGVGRRELLWAASGICSARALPLLQASLEGLPLQSLDCRSEPRDGPLPPSLTPSSLSPQVPAVYKL